MIFSSVILGYLTGFASSIIANLTSSDLYQSITQEDLSDLIRECLSTAINDKSELLNKFVVQTDPRMTLSAHLDTDKLAEFLKNDDVIEPLTSQDKSSNRWRAYLKPFSEIIIIPGCPLSEDDHLDLINNVLEHASRIFNSIVPRRHPVFEQILLGYQEKQCLQHDQILEKIESLPEKTAEEIKRIQLDEESATEQHTACLSDWENPFSVVAADNLDLSNIEHVRQIKNLFVSRYTDISTIRKHFNTILEGQRGTGKTMILKHLSFETQILEWCEQNRQPNDYFTDAGNFIGVYSKLSQGVFDKTDFEAIDDQARRERVFEHRIVLQLLYDVLKTVRRVLQYLSPSNQSIRQVMQALQAFLKSDGILDSCTGLDDFIECANNHISFKLIPEVDEYLGSVSPGAPGGQTVFNPRLTLSGQIIPFISLLKSTFGISLPFFIMLDDFDVLESYQQGCVFGAASQREFSVVCFKFGISALGRKTSLSGPNRTFREGDDYDLIDLDWTQGGLHDKYQEAVAAIAAARIKQANWPIDILSLLPSWDRGIEIRKEVESIMLQEWDEQIEKRPKSKSDYISKYGNARYFQTLRERKIRVRYAGLDNVTMVSSGIFRQFLEVCKLIFDRAHDDGWIPQNGGINPEIQDRAIREYSNEMIKQFTRTSGDAHALLSGDIEVTSTHMVTLIESLCDLFYSRLHTPNHGEPEIICIAIKDDLYQCNEARTYLNIAVRESILHRFQYPPKTSGGPDLPAFMLNRRLGPRRDLSIARMQGRIEIESRDILLAVANRNAFFNKLSRIKKTKKDVKQQEIGLENFSEWE